MLGKKFFLARFKCGEVVARFSGYFSSEMITRSAVTINSRLYLKAFKSCGQSKRSSVFVRKMKNSVLLGVFVLLLSADGKGDREIAVGQLN